MWLVLVGRRGNKRVILWRNVGRITLLVTLLSTVLSTLAYVAIARRWNPDAPLGGLIAGVGIAVVLLLVNLLTPIRHLPFLPRER
jgi:hypothetical protein